MEIEEEDEIGGEDEDKTENEKNKEDAEEG